MITTIDAAVPTGFEPTGEYREPKEGEWFLNTCNCAVQCAREFTFPKLILRKSVDAWEIPSFLPAHNTYYLYYYSDVLGWFVTDECPRRPALKLGYYTADLLCNFDIPLEDLYRLHSAAYPAPNLLGHCYKVENGKLYRIDE